jgi:hypothetical protein
MDNNKKESEKSESDNSDIEEYKKMKENDKGNKKEKNLGRLLKTIVKKTKKIKGEYILSKNKIPLEKIKNEEMENAKRREKRILRNIKIRLGYVKFDEWDKSYEKKLLKATRRGVVKFFNSIVEHRKQEIEMQKNEEAEAKKKSNNFLMMHNLKYLDSNDEDEENEEKNKEDKRKIKIKKEGNNSNKKENTNDNENIKIIGEEQNE